MQFSTSKKILFTSAKFFGNACSVKFLQESGYALETIKNKNRTLDLGPFNIKTLSFVQ